MTARLLTHCGVCGGDRLESVLSLGSSPPTCVMVPVGVRQASEDHHPLELLRCHDCTLVQLSVIVDPEVVFPPEYPYSSGNSRALHENFADLARQADEWVGGLCPTDLVVDIGANDGTLLSKFMGKCVTVGVEPTGQARRIAGPAYREFFTEELAKRILAEHGQAKVITACNVLAHVADIGDVMRGIDVLLAGGGVLVAENHDLASVVGGQWDTVYHEHLRFYDPHSFNALLGAHGFGVREWEQIPTHGGSFRAVAGRGRRVDATPRREYDFERLARAADNARIDLRAAAYSGARMCGIGATARATTIINYCGLDVDDITYVCEVSGSDKIGHYIPGTRIPVVDEARLFEDQQDAVLFSWHLAGVIVPKLRERGYTGEIILPLPTLQTA
jgi:hypothetical protein